MSKHIAISQWVGGRVEDRFNAPRQKVESISWIVKLSSRHPTNSLHKLTSVFEDLHIASILRWLYLSLRLSVCSPYTEPSPTPWTGGNPDCAWLDRLRPRFKTLHVSWRDTALAVPLAEAPVGETLRQS